MRRAVILSVVGSVAAGLMFMAAAALADPGRRRGSGGGQDEFGEPGRLVRMIGRKLDLTAEQKNSLRDLLGSHAAQMQAAKRDISDARRSLGDLVLGENPDEAAIRAASAQLGSAIGTASVLTAQLAGEVRPLLTPEQLKQLAEMRERRAERQDKRREHRRNRIKGGDDK